MWIRNRTSFQAHFLAYPKYANGQPVAECQIRQAWDEALITKWLEVPQHDTREFRITGLSPSGFQPALLDLRGAVSTLKVRSKTYELSFTHTF